MERPGMTSGSCLAGQAAAWRRSTSARSRTRPTSPEAPWERRARPGLSPTGAPSPLPAAEPQPSSTA
eukprot:11767292-Alexandrium_andersonii.AAC.1